MRAGFESTMRLDGLRILDFCWVGAGAFVTRILADLGAEVIKVESRAHPDNLRLSPPHKPGAAPLEGSGYFASRNTSKKSIALNMTQPEARDIALRLAQQCSIVSNNFRPGVMDKWGLGYQQIAAVNPSIIYLAMPMQGSRGPHRDYIGFGSTIAALCGLVNMAGKPGRAPIGTGTHYPDHVPNPGHALVAVLAAAFHRARTGEGQYVELAQIELTVNMLGPHILAWSANGTLPEVNGNRRPGAVPRGVFPCIGEDAWCAIEVAGDAQWRRLADAIGFARMDARSRFDDRCRPHAARGRDRAQASAGNQALCRVRLGRVVAGPWCGGIGGGNERRCDARRPACGARLLERRSPPRDAIGAGQQAALPHRWPGTRAGRPAAAARPAYLEVATTLLGLDETECQRLIDEKVFY